MKNSIEIQNEELIISKFSIENITDNKESFYKVINDIYLKYKNIESGIRRNYDNKKCSKEIETNLFNINNILADRELEKVEYVYDFEYYGRCFNEENYNKLKPFIALCRVLNAMHKKYENTDNYTEIIKMCKFLEEEIRYNLDRTY